MKSYWRRGGNEEGGDGEGRWGCNMGGGVVRKGYAVKLKTIDRYCYVSCVILVEYVRGKLFSIV